MKKASRYWKRKRREFILKYGRRAWKRYLNLRAHKRYAKSWRGKYARQKQDAKTRGIPWQFTPETWRAKWMANPERWENRGNRAGQYCMARIGDTGPYSDENCVIVRVEANSYAALHRANGHAFNPRAMYADEAATIL